MTIPAEKLVQLKSSFPEATVSHEAGGSYILFPSLTAIFAGEERTMDVLLCPMKHISGYTSKLFLPEVIQSGQNWKTFCIQGRVWHSPSFNGVLETQPLKEILMAHLRPLKDRWPI